MDLLDMIDFDEDEEDAPSPNLDNMVQCLPRKHLKDVYNPFDKLTDQDFFERFRFSKQHTVELFQFIKDDVMLQVRSHALQPIMMLVCALRFFATGHFQKTDGDLLGISRHTARRSIHTISRVIAKSRQLFIPQVNDSNEIKEAFYDIAGFPNVIGCIDCTHIPIVSPGGPAPEIYRCRKGYFSLNCQMVCNADRTITNIVARWPGSTHDSRIFTNSSLKLDFDLKKYDGLLLGDAGYALQCYLITPLANPETNKEKRFNYAHAKTRGRIEQCFGVLKQRFRMLRIPLRMEIKNAIPAIVAAACLHNYAIRTNTPLHDDHNASFEEPADNVTNREDEMATTADGRAIRQSIITSYF